MESQQQDKDENLFEREDISDMSSVPLAAAADDSDEDMDDEDEMENEDAADDEMNEDL